MQRLSKLELRACTSLGRGWEDGHAGRHGLFGRRRGKRGRIHLDRVLAESRQSVGWEGVSALKE
jgi:hypothetical protein